MKNYKNAIFYSVILAFFGSIMYWVTLEGKHLEVDVIPVHSALGPWSEFLDSMLHNLQHPLAILLIQIIAIVLVARLFGWLFKKIGQPSVIGEIIAGIALGPSLFGAYFPEASAALFPIASLGNLQFLSQIGLILFMFVIGMELDLKVLKNKANEAVIISHASIVIPFALGMVLAYFIYTHFAPTGVGFLSFALFLGIAMSITAFPVLARIVTERGMQKTKLGTVVITAAAADDITAWCILAIVIAIVKAGSFISSLYVIGLAIAYVFIMIKLVRPFLKRVGDLSTTKNSLTKSEVAIFFITLMISAYCTEIIGIHALFGAFMCGAIMPDNSRFRHLIIDKVEDLSITLFLPLFFVYTGLRTQIGLINDAYLWKITGFIILVAVVGKFVGSALAARFIGQNWRDSLTIGALMNTRGLMELVVLNIGFDLGVLTPEVFAMMVIMALVTTFMTGPAIDLINRIFRSKDLPLGQEITELNKYKILFSFGNPERGKKLLRLGNALTKKQVNNASLTGILMGASEDLHFFEENFEQKNLTPIIEESQLLNQKIQTLFKISSDIESDVIEMSNKGDYDLLLMHVGESIYDGTLLGKLLGYTTRIINPDRLIDKFTGKEGLFENSPFDENTRYILTNTKIPVGVFIDKNLENIDNIMIPIFSKEDVFLIEYAQKFIHNNDAQLVVVDVYKHIKNNFTLKELIRSIEQVKPNHITVLENNAINTELLTTQNLMVISLDSWKKLVESRSVWLKNTPSVLIIKP
ncbi:MAG: cation:proton antiporter [Flavobacterium sp.]|nr:cation:proton antiporter [Candidatus Neoflavobacterium equi]